ncbi:MAG: phospholipase D family protein [Armatimonadota bacterium]
MLRPAHDRLDLSQLLMPPAGYRFDAAVGTTYSLDLAAMLGIPVSLVLGQAPDEHIKHQGIPLLEAIRKAAGRMAIFCQAGRIAVPQTQRPLFALLEHSLATVMPADLYSFHPKVWVIRYAGGADQSDIRYKVFVLSRNLTFDRSWDIAVVLEGKPTGSTQRNNAPLSAFLNALVPWHPNSRMRRMVHDVAEQIQRVKFDLTDHGFERYSFHAYGMGDVQEPYWPCEDTYHEITIISPFLHPKRIAGAKQRLLTHGSMLLVSRKDELDKIDPRILDGIDCWHLHDQIIDGESSLDDSTLPHSHQDIHAKLYLTTKYSESSLWIGSANCSEKAFTGNVEFMVRLQGYRRYCNQEMIRAELFGTVPNENPFIEYAPTVEPVATEDTTEEREVEALVRAICRSKVKASASLEEQGGHQYRVDLTWSDLPSISLVYKVMIHPLNKPVAHTVIESQLTFPHIDLVDLGSLFVVTIAHRKSPQDILRAFILPIPVTGIPAARDQAIYKSTIHNQEEFFTYLALLLGDDYMLSLVEQRLSHRLGQRSDEAGKVVPVIYEKMLKAASRRPEAIKEIREIIEMVGQEERIVSKEFQALYQQFEAAVKHRRKRT